MIVWKPGDWIASWTRRYIYVRLHFLGRELPLCKRQRRFYRSLATDEPWVRRGAVKAKLKEMKQDGE